MISPEGVVVEVSDVVGLDALPAAAMSAVRSAVGTADITRVEKSEVFAEIGGGAVRKLDRSRLEYEIEVTSGGKRGEIVVGSDGSIVENLNWKGARDDEDED